MYIIELLNELDGMNGIINNNNKKKNDKIK